ncbi:MAG: hypothetical protein JWO62_1555 [Acidimicrobiaceae bacterium]|nr:hypothetical protein [Acidimicrobiaceae bacterium]
MKRRSPAANASERLCGQAPNDASIRPAVGSAEIADRLRILVVLSPAAGRLTMVASERGGEGVRRGVAGAAGYLGEAEFAGAEVVSGEGHAPLGEVLHRCLA